MPFTNDPIADFLRHDAEQHAWLDSLPRCSECEEPIQDDSCFEFGDELICDECMHSNHRKHL
jgi:formylmethanofuran dehydrogenase subunit E